VTDPKKLARAKRVREKGLARLTALYQACDCTWPIDRFRHRSGHASTCPAYKLHAQFCEEDEDTQTETEL
jgi:hypothetical protein